MQAESTHFQHPINFVHRGFCNWQDIATPTATDTTIDNFADRLMMGREVWGVQAFHLLRQRGHLVQLSDDYKEGAINIVHREDLDSATIPDDIFIVSIRADRDPSFDTQMEIVQNRHSVWRKSDIYIPHWPQPGIIPRDPARAATIENLVFMGKACHLADAFSTPEFTEALTKLGVKLRIQDNNWWDYQSADIVLAIRKGSPFYLSIKPASKLVNAWHAGCPAILGNEAGYTELRRSELDFFATDSPGEVLRFILELKSDPSLFLHMVEQGRKRASEFTREVVLDRWEQSLAGPISRRYEYWLARKRDNRTMAALRKLWIVSQQRLWGVQAIGQQPSARKELLATARRAIVLPKSAFPKNGAIF